MQYLGSLLDRGIAFLEVFTLTFRGGGEALAPGAINSALLEILRQMPSLTKFKFMITTKWGMAREEITPIVEALSVNNGNSFILLPRVKALEFQHTVVSAAKLMELITTRWRVEDRTLGDVSLIDCLENSTPNDFLPSYRRNDVHESWSAVHACVEEGFSFECL